MRTDLTDELLDPLGESWITPGFPPIPSGLEVDKFKEEEFPVVDIFLQPRINRNAAGKLEERPSSERAGVRLQLWS